LAFTIGVLAVDHQALGLEGHAQTFDVTRAALDGQPRCARTIMNTHKKTSKKRLDDEAFMLERSIWEEATQVYLLLRGIARSDVDLRMALGEIEEPRPRDVKHQRHAHIFTRMRSVHGGL
jgi:hypothetical protein